MTNFSRAFYEMIDGGDIARKEDRIARNISEFDLSAEDAVLLDNTCLAVCRNIQRILGNAVDRLPPQVRLAALRSIPPTATRNLNSTCEMVAVVLLGLPWEVLESPLTEGCNCPGCNSKRFLTEQIMAVTNG